MESRTQGSRPRPRTQKKHPWPRPRTTLLRTDPLEAKDRNAQGQEPRTQHGSHLRKKRSSLQNFRRSQKKWSSLRKFVNFPKNSGVLKKKKRSSLPKFKRSPGRKCLQNFFRKLSCVLREKTKLVMTLGHFP